MTLRKNRGKAIKLSIQSLNFMLSHPCPVTGICDEQLQTEENCEEDQG
jgi:hypothetical protein